MSVYDLYQSYLNQQQVSPVQPDIGIMDPMLLYPQNYESGGEYRGGGLFGNLDLSNSKTFTKDVYSDELGPPGAFEFSPQEIQAYYNPTLGNYQTYEGKNINPMFSNTGATFGLAGLAMKMMGLTPETVGGFIPNSIRGYYDTPKDFFNTITGENRRVEQQKALEEAAAAKRNIQQYTGGGGDTGGGGSRDNTGGDRGSAGAADRFSNTSGRGRTGY